MRAVPSERLQTSLNTGWENDSTRNACLQGGMQPCGKPGPPWQIHTQRVFINVTNRHQPAASGGCTG